MAKTQSDLMTNLINEANKNVELINRPVDEKEPFFDLAIHLVGRQPFPNLLGMRNLLAKRHVLLASENQISSVTAQKLKLVEGNDDRVKIETVKDPNDVGLLVSEINRRLQVYENQENFEIRKIAVNFTSGTKLMAFAMQNAFDKKRYDVDYYYYDTEYLRRFHCSDENDETRFETTDFSNIKINPIKLDDFIKLFKFEVNPAREDYDDLVREREKLTQKLWSFRKTISVKLNGNPSAQMEALSKKEAIKNRRNADSICSFRGRYDNSQAKQVVAIDYVEGHGGYIQFNDERLDILPNWNDFLDYLGGKWFEEYVYLTLKKLAEDDRKAAEQFQTTVGADPQRVFFTPGRLLEIRPNVSLRSDEAPDRDMREFDLLATDGIRLFIVECKAGSISSEIVQKIDQRVHDNAGDFGVGFLVAQRYQNEDDENYGELIKTIFEEVRKSRHTYLFHGDRCVERLGENIPYIGTPKVSRNNRIIED